VREIMMNQNIAKHSLQAALTVAALMVVQSAWASQPSATSQPTYNIELNNFWAGTPNSHGWNSGFGLVTVKYSGGTVWYDSSKSVPTNYSVYGGSGGFKTYNLTTDPGRKKPFETFCVDIFHDFGFAVTSPDAGPMKSPAGLSSAAILNLDRLYTLYGSNIASTSSSGLNESAFQLAVWAIVNDGAAINQAGMFNITSGQPISFTNDSTGGAVSLAQQWLNSLVGVTSKYNAEFYMVQNHGGVGTWGAQDVLFFSPVPEPQTYAMLLAGLGLVGLIARRRKSLNLV
jgi:hypothetical protein